MRRGVLARFTILTIGILSVGFVLGARTTVQFRPPKTGVVDVTQVFGEYEKSVEMRGKLKRDARDIHDRIAELENRAANMLRDLRMIRSRDKQYEKMVERYKLELKARQMREIDLPRLAQQGREQVAELQQEIEQQIEMIALANNLELVLEKSVQLELKGESRPLRWPVVHFVVPELDITREVTLRLNEMYRK